MNCVCCNEAISAERLEALPGVEFCVKCAGAINPRHQKLTIARAIQDEPIDEEEGSSDKIPAWNERNPDINVNSTDEELLKEAM